MSKDKKGDKSKKRIENYISSSTDLSKNTFEKKLSKLNNKISKLEKKNSKIKKQNKKLSNLLTKSDSANRKKSRKKNVDESYRDLFNCVIEAIYIQDKDGIFIDVNKGAELMYGYSKDEFIGRTPEFLSAPDKNDFENIFSLVKNTFETGIPYKFEFWGRRKNGEIFPKEVCVSKVKYFGKDCIIAVARDISERKIFELTIKQNEEKYRRIIETANEGVWTLNKEGISTFVNARCAEMFGYQIDEMLNKSLWQFIFDEDIPQRNELLERRKKNLSDQLELRFKKKDGTELWTFASITTILDENKKFNGSFGMFTDITEKRKIENELREKEKRIINIVEHSTNLFYTHDVNNKITYISPQTRTFYDCEPEEALVKWTEYVTDNPANVIGLDLTLKAIETGKQQKPYILELKGKKGRIVWVEVHESPVVVNGKTVEIIGSLTDITERKKVEDALKESEEKLRKNNELLHSILESPKGMIIFSLDVNYRYTAFTLSHKETMKLIWGVDIEIGMNMLDAIKNDADRQKAKNNFDKTLNGEYLVLLEEYGDEALYRTFYEDRYSPIFDENNLVTGLTVFVTDRTDRIKAEKALQESEEKYRSIFENSTEGIFRSTFDGKYLSVNNAMAKMLGYSNPQEVFDSITDIKSQIFVNPADRDKMMDLLNENNFLRDYELEFKRKDDTKFWVSTYIRKIEDEKNKIFLIEGITQDISERKRMIKELIEAKEKAEELNKIKSNFFANMSHELRTPLIGILGFTEILLDELSDAKYQNMLKIMLRGGRRLSHTLNLILDLSKIESQKIDLKLSTVSVVNLTNEIAELFKGSAELKGLQFTISALRNNIYVKLDKNLFREILDNLINNAIKYTHEGEVKIEIDVEQLDNNNNAVIKVSDTGIGISIENFEKIFEEFRQVSEGWNRSFEGTGLGLTITKKLVELMNGTISVESKLGVGSSFILKFPLSDDLDEGEYDEEKKWDSNYFIQVLDIFKQRGYSPKILFVENDEATQDVIKFYLKDICNVDIASNANSAMQKIAENIYDAILMDINLGKGISGLDIIQEIRKDENYKNIPIAAVTAFAMKSDEEEFLSKGCSYYLSKPFNRNEFISFILKILNKQN